MKDRVLNSRGNLVQGDVERTAVEVLRTNMDRAMQQCFQDVMRITGLYSAQAEISVSQFAGL